MIAAGSSFEAIGVRVQVLVTDAERLADAYEVLAGELRALDVACSRFRPDSELSRLNTAAGRPFFAGDLLRDALVVALRAAAATDGVVDPTIGRSIRALGWDRDFSLVLHRESPPRVEIVPAAGWATVDLDPATGRVVIPAGVELDLGATAKAFAADRCARLIHQAAGCGVLVNLGGDIAVAGTPPAGGWNIAVADNHRSGVDAAGQTVSIASGGLATSSTTVRRWRAAGAEQHHIVDPRTGRPAAEHWRTVSVAAVDCVEANAASTTAIVLGPAAVDWLERRELPARLVRRDGSVTATCGWPS